MVNDEEKEKPRSRINVLGGIVGNGLALVPHGNDQGAEIMDRPHEDTAHKDPDQGRYPAPDYGHSRAHNGTGA